ncbi:hypothetical protein [Nocardia sp. NPDC005366]|uniref:hypothetical protein n=1 Tax=Nocardia sp. NPDC005366 TaxID=3156878 RepID=UPI0033BB15A2
MPVAAATYRPEPRGIQAILRGQQLGRAPVITAAYAAGTKATVALLVTLDAQAKP